MNTTDVCHASHLENTLVGVSPAIETLRAQVRRYAPTNAPILIQGETGTGKERTAELFHTLSARSKRPFVAVNCAAIPPDLVEAELFGTIPGAFTGARKRLGCFSAARGGTLFLDEVADMSLSTQGCLLRVLETGVYRSVGSDQPQQANVRLVCATHQHLRTAVERGQFRDDLLHRIATITVQVPSLRHRTDDLKPIAADLFPTSVEHISPSAWATLRAYDWPGNVREFRNVLWRAILDAGSDLIEPSHVQFQNWGSPGMSPSQSPVLPLHEALKEYVKSALNHCRGNVRETSRRLEVSPTTVYRYLALSKRDRVPNGSPHRAGRTGQRTTI